MDRTKRISVKALNASRVNLSWSEWPIDYGHCGEIMRDKYGNERGQKMYDEMVEMSGNASARFFVVATQILREKRAMMNLLGLHGDLDSKSYEELYDRWQASLGK